MSASLVGSEMCIRDSSLPLMLDGLTGRADWRCTQAPQQLLELAVGPGRGCLLYTSDAADDM
eukprot:12579840-Alexandrium_andersonii.AAC.1